MAPEHIKMLEDQRPAAEKVIAGHGTRSIRMDALFHILKAEFNPNYRFNEWEVEEVVAMIKEVYRFFDEYKAKNPA